MKYNSVVMTIVACVAFAFAGAMLTGASFGGTTPCTDGGGTGATCSVTNLTPCGESGNPAGGTNCDSAVSECKCKTMTYGCRCTKK